MKIGSFSTRYSARTMDGNFVGIVQFDSWSGNEVWLFHVASTPFIMRSIPNGNYELVWEAYINGRMEEEAYSL